MTPTICQRVYDEATGKDIWAAMVLSRVPAERLAIDDLAHTGSPEARIRLRAIRAYIWELFIREWGSALLMRPHPKWTVDVCVYTHVRN
jgi:hypothetical protein